MDCANRLYQCGARKLCDIDWGIWWNVALHSRRQRVRSRRRGLQARIIILDVHWAQIMKLDVRATKEVSRLLQSTKTLIDEAMQQVNVVKRFLQRQRSDEAFRLLYDHVVLQSSSCTHPPTLPRQRRLPARYDNGRASDTTHHATPADVFRKEYVEVIDVIIGELDKRFDQCVLKIPRQTEKLLLSAANWTTHVNLPVDEKVLTFYKDDVNSNNDVNANLECCQIWSARSHESRRIQESENGVYGAIAGRHNQNVYDWHRHMFTAVVKLLRIFMTVSVSTATAERSFSALRRLKTYLIRSTMTQQRSNNAIVTHCHKPETDGIDLISVAK